MHEVQCPHWVHRLRRQNRLPFARDNLLFRPVRQVRLHAAIHAMHVLVVPRIALVAQPLEVFPEATAAILRCGFIERVAHRCIMPDGIG